MEKLPPVHPGEVLLEDFMKPLGLSQYRVAKDIDVPPLRISQIVRGMRSVTPDTALRLARYFGTTPGIWMRLQAQYDLEISRAKHGETIDRVVKVLELQRPFSSASPVPAPRALGAEQRDGRNAESQKLIFTPPIAKE